MRFFNLAALTVLCLAASAHAQPPGTRVTKTEKDYGPYGIYGPGLSYKPPTFFVTRPVSTTIAVGTSVSVPDRGTALLGGYKSFSEGRNEFGSPILSKSPYVKPLTTNVGYGRSVISQTVSVRVRVIDLREEEMRQTGVGR